MKRKIKLTELQARIIYAACNDRMTKLTLKFGGKNKKSDVNTTWFQAYQEESDNLISIIKFIEETFKLNFSRNGNK